MLSIALAAAIAAQQEPIVPIVRPGKDGRGRDPWVFRCIFEDRTRMLILALAKDWWLAFNPETCAVHKVWNGAMDYRGKVWDFSQDNSRADGRIYLNSPSEMWRLPSEALPEGWKQDGVVWDKDGWLFTTNGSSLTSGAYDASSWQRVFLAFDETGRKARFKATIFDELTKVSPQFFESATHVDNESAWQWNFKRIELPTSTMRVRVESPIAGKKLRSLRLYGDRPSWLGSDGKPLNLLWQGYDLINQTKGVSIRYEVQHPKKFAVAVVQSMDLTDSGWFETFEVSGLPLGESIFLRREGLSERVDVRTNLDLAQGTFAFRSDGKHRIDFTLPAGERR